MFVTSQLPIHITKIVYSFFDVHFEKGSSTHGCEYVITVHDCGGPQFLEAPGQVPTLLSHKSGPVVTRDAVGWARVPTPFFTSNVTWRFRFFISFLRVAPGAA